MTTRKPEWLKKKVNFQSIQGMEEFLDTFSLHTVCREANCPNRAECFESRTATFMILGRNCTRNCRFCTVSKGPLDKVDENEPENVAKAARQLNLKHVVVTSVTRDDLEDNGANQFAETIVKIREYLPESTVEVLIPDFQGDIDCLKIVLDKKPDILNHNIETVKSLYQTVRPMAVYERSLELLKRVKQINPEIHTKSGVMVGLGETKEQIYELMDDLLDAGCDILTIGQYLQPTKEHLPVAEYVRPEVFDEYKKTGLEKGFKFIASGPLVRSSYDAAKGMEALK